MSNNLNHPSQQAFVNNGANGPPNLAAVNGKVHMNGAHPDAYASTTTTMSSAGARRASNDSQPSFVDPAAKPFPKIGETRCYWSMLSAALDFIYLDPVLQSHLEEQAELLLGKSLLDFVHPDERASAEYDLGSVLDNKTLHGSVTRVRYSRLSRIRYELGHRIATSPWEEADRIALDSNYMAVDIVINWAADGLVLCFIHAVTDLGPEDNDEQHKTHWTNWCGTPYMSMQQIELLYNRLLVCIQIGPGSRVFQIMTNENGKELMMTWPPDQGQGRDYAKLVEDVNIHSGDHGGDGAKTSCTRRYKACQLMQLGEIESIIVPHGTIVFACHKVTAPSRVSPTAGMHQLGYNTDDYLSQQQNQPYYDQSGNGYPTPPPYPASAPPYGNGYHQQPGYPPQHWPDGSDAALAPAAYPPQQQWSNQQYMDSSQAYPRTETPEYGYSASAGNPGGSPSGTSDVVPPPRRRASPAIPGTTRETHSARSSGSRPAGIQKCTSCKTTQSPEWRKGPSGKKELCNACGLRYARSRAKKEGTAVTSNRKRKEKNLTVSTKSNSKRESGSPSPNDRPARRPRREEAPVSDSEQPAKLEHASHSPSPPESSSSFVHYAHPNGAHQRNSQIHSTGDNSPYPDNKEGMYSNAGVGANGHPSSQMSAIRMDSSYPRMSGSSIAPASYEREKDRELPPTPVSPESRLSSARSMLMLQQ